MKRAIVVGFFGGLLLFPLHLPSADAGGVPGTKQRITFEGVVTKHDQDDIPGGYDGFGWSSSIWAVGKGLYKDHQGFQSVVHGKVAAVFFSGTGVDGIIQREDNGVFSIRSGNFAAFGNTNIEVNFSAYKQGVLVGTNSMTIGPVDTPIEFDKTFSHIDKFVIQGESLAMDNLHVSF